MKLTSDLQREKMKATSQWDANFEVLKENNGLTRILFTEKLSFKY